MIKNTHFVPFSAQTRMSGIDFLDEQGKVIRSIRKGAADAIQRHVESNKAAHFPAALRRHWTHLQ